MPYYSVISDLRVREVNLVYVLDERNNNVQLVRTEKLDKSHRSSHPRRRSRACLHPRRGCRAPRGRQVQVCGAGVLYTTPISDFR